MDQSSFERFTNSKIYSLGEKLGDIMLLSFFFILTSLPVVTIGASATALYYAVHKRFKDNSAHPISDYFRSFRQNLLQGIIITVILLLYGGITAFNIFVALFGYNGVHLPSWYAPVAVLLILPFVFTATYVFPYLARFKNGVGGTIFHSFTFSTMYAGHTFLMWLYIIISIALMIFFFPSLLFMPFICCYLCWRLCERDFNYAIILKDKREHPEKYQEETASEDDEDDEYEYEDDDEDEEDDEDDDEDIEEEETETAEDDDEEASEVDEETSEE